MNKIWIVFYDDAVAGAFDSEELADMFKNAFGLDRVQECELNPMEKEVRDGYKGWQIEMGKDSMVFSAGITDAYERRVLRFKTKVYDKNFRSVPRDSFIVRLLAKSKGEAIMIVNEIRARLIAENRWGSKEIAPTFVLDGRRFDSFKLDEK